jgi:ferredoxin
VEEFEGRIKMPARIIRKIIQIDEEKCNGCGACIDSCAEGALALVNGKAKLVKDQYCDGLAACLKECPQNALHIIEREAAEFDEKAAHDYLAASSHESELAHWPVQLTLVPAGAKFLDRADVMLIAQCVPFAYADLHLDFLKGHGVLTACPKLDDADAHLNKMTEILKKSNLKSLTVVRMEVPCCSGLTSIAKKALILSETGISLREIVVGIDGKIH